MMNEYLAKLAEFVHETPELLNELVKVDGKFPSFEAQDSERRMMIFDWFLFDHKLARSKKTPLRLFIDTYKGLTNEKREIYRAFERNVFGVFEVKAVNLGKRMILKDLTTEREYSVNEKTATRYLRKKQCIFARVLPYKDHYILSGSVSAYPEDATYTLRMGHRRIREKNIDTKITPRDVAELFSGLQAEERPKDMDLETLKKKLREALKGMGLPRSTFRDILNMIQGGAELDEVLALVTGKAAFHSEETAGRFLKLLTALWNKLAHNGVTGMSPEEKDEIYRRGPQESALMRALLDHVNDVVNPEAYSDREEFDQAVEAAQEKWFDTVNPDLDGRTPREVILAERSSLGNTRSEIGVRVLTYPLHVLSKKEREAHDIYKQALEMTKEARYEEAIKEYERHLNYRAWGNKGLLHGLLLDKKEAIRCLHRSLSIEPGYKIAKNNLELIEKATKRELRKMAEHLRVKSP